jgi:hypothetical protein
MMKRHGVYALLLLSLIGSSAYSQENQLVTGTIVQRPAQQVVSDDTIPAINLSEEELDNIVDIRKQFEKQNKTYSAPKHEFTAFLEERRAGNLGRGDVLGPSGTRRLHDFR